MGTIPMPIVEQSHPSQEDETDPELSEGASNYIVDADNNNEGASNYIVDADNDNDNEGASHYIL